MLPAAVGPSVAAVKQRLQAEAAAINLQYFSFGSDAVLAWRILLYCAAWILFGAALIGLSVYIVLLGSEVLFSERHNKGTPGRSTRHEHKVARIESDPLASRHTPCYGQSSSPSQMMSPLTHTAGYLEERQ
jgi:hypothetical protein